MTESELAQIIEASKHTVLRAIGQHLPGEPSAQIEDVAQETYLRYFLHFKSRPKLNGDEIHRWLYVAARNECRNAARKSRREGFALFRFEWNSKKEPANEETFREDEKLKSLANTIQQMPEPFREVTQLRAGGMKISDIAKKLKVSAGTVKSRLSRGKEWLARSMTDSDLREAGL